MKKLVVLAASLGMLAAFSAPSPASAGGGTFTQTQRITTQVVPLTAPPPLPPSCPVQLPVVIVSNNGNGVLHLTANGNGDWFTSTFEGDATVFLLLGFDAARKPILGAPTFQGHLETWFGGQDNLDNSVFHTTLNYHGTSLTDPSQSVTINGVFGFTTNANGDLTAGPIRLDCH